MIAAFTVPDKQGYTRSIMRTAPQRDKFIKLKTKDKRKAISFSRAFRHVPKYQNGEQQRTEK